MIIRRHHTANFTTIGNALFDDVRLSLDDIGLLVWLLSRPHDWEIRRPALRRRHKIGAKKLGAEGIRRIIHNLMKTGWCRAEKIRLSNGTFSVTYEIRDEPGPEMSEAEVIEALSLVSSEADDASDEEDIDPVPPDKPPPTSPELASQLRQGVRGPVIKDLPNTDSPNTDSTKAPPLWREFRKLWPSGDILSPLACEKLFAALSPDDRQRAFDGVSPYLKNCHARQRKVCDLSTYLKERRFKGNLAVAQTTFAIHRGTPQACRWLEYRKAIGEPTAWMESLWREGKPWYAPTEWPPPALRKESPEPPTLLSPADDQFIRKQGLG